MAHPLRHAESSARKFGGEPKDYLTIHNWFDESKALFVDFRHRALRHHSDGIFLAEKLFGIAIVNSDGKQVPVRHVGEQHAASYAARVWWLSSGLMSSKPVSGQSPDCRQGQQLTGGGGRTAAHTD